MRYIKVWGGRCVEQTLKNSVCSKPLMVDVKRLAAEVLGVGESRVRISLRLLIGLRRLPLRLMLGL